MEAATRPPKPARGTQLELTVDALAFGGNGVARMGGERAGYVVFVGGTVPGDRVRAEVTRAKRGYAEARLLEVVQPSPQRIAPRADHPGVPWQVLPYERQLEVKAEQVDDALRRIGRLEGFELEPMIPAVAPWRYRNKLEYSFGVDDAGTLVCGFHAPGRWDRIEPMADCLLASERGNAVREAVLTWCVEQGLGAYDRRLQSGFLRNLVVRESARTGQVQVRLVTSPGTLDGDGLVAALDVDGVLWTQVDGPAETTATGRTELLGGAEHLEEELGGLRFAVSPYAFFQTNTEMAEELYAVAGEYAALQGRERVYDLFCGIGTIGLTLATRAAQLYGLEVVPEAVADARRNAARNDVEHAEWVAGDVRLVLRDLVERVGRPDVVVVDPPRAGLSQKVVRRVLEAAPRRLVYVSCNPTTLAPNAAQMVEAGYRLTRVRPVDMFPQTPHIECVALLERA